MIWFILVVLILAYAYTKINSCLQVLQKRGVKCRKPVFLFGNSLGSITGKETMVDMIRNNYEAFPDSRYSGMYMMMISRITIRDPELIRKITVGDFDHFVDHTPFLSDDREPLWTRNLLSLRGERWREMRSTLSPSFTSSKMRSMFVLMSECAGQFLEYLEAGSNGDGVRVLEFKDTFTRVANDVIATCAFGVQVDSLRNRENEFYLMGKEATNFSGFWNNIRFAILFGLPRLAQFLGISMFTKPVHHFFRNLVRETVRGREEQGIVRPDMIQMLVDAKKGRFSSEDHEVHSQDTGFATVEEYSKGKVQKTAKDITLDDMTAQALIFFFAGFDTVSVLLCFVCYELALNPDVQERLRVEVAKTFAENITYESLNRMKYLDMVVSETLRKWPAMIALDRMCVSDYTIPAERDNEVDLTIEKGESIGISIYGMHRDPKFYPSPEKFDPERFSDENKHKIKPYTYLPFGAGPRNCIGSRFALLEVKVMLVHLLAKFEILPVEKTSIPLKILTSGPNLNSADGFWLGLKKRLT